MKNYIIAPSLLSADFLALGMEISNLIAAGADMLHLDVMDNHYVPNISFGLPICQAISKGFPLAILDVHLMVTPVDELIIAFAKAGAKRITIHPDTTLHLHRSLALIKELNCAVGLALNPATDPNILHWCEPYLDFVLVMLVNPGFAGQTLIPEVVAKITWINKAFPGLAICTDGGINIDNIAMLAAAGASEFVLGSAIFTRKNYQETIAALRKQLLHD